MNALNVDYTITGYGFTVKVNKGRLPVKYPEEIWSRFPSKIKKIVIENFVFLSTLSLPSMSGSKKINYQFKSPLLGSFFIKPILFYIPSGAEEYGKDSFSLLRNLMNTAYTFKGYDIKLSDYTAKVQKRSVILFTFGKDSLLSYAVAREINLNPTLVYIEEPDTAFKNPVTKRIEHTYENMHKAELIRKFAVEFKETIHRVKNGVGMVRNSDFFGNSNAEIPWGSQLTEYALLSIPLNHHFKARYLIYGNEASCSESYYNKDNLLTYPVFDQSREWTMEISKLLKLLTKKVSAISLLEPIHEIAITYILHKRYPEYGAYQMSCFADSDNAKNSRWCHNCSKCGRMFIFLKANGIDPATVGLKEDMLAGSKADNYSLFGTDAGKPYDVSGLGRDEQLLAFHLAYLRGARGKLMKVFEKTLLKEAKKKFRRLMKEYFSTHETITLPLGIRKRAVAIYESELKNARKEIMRLWRDSQ